MKIKETDGPTDHSRGCWNQIVLLRLCNKYLEIIPYNYFEEWGWWAYTLTRKALSNIRWLFTIKCKVGSIGYFWNHSQLGLEFHWACEILTDTSPISVNTITLESYFIPWSDSSHNLVGFPFKPNLKSVHVFPPPLLRSWSKPPSSHTWPSAEVP